MSSFDPSIFRAYDMRGTYPDQMNETVAYAAGQAFVAITGAKMSLLVKMFAQLATQSLRPSPAEWLRLEQMLFRLE